MTDTNINLCINCRTTLDGERCPNLACIEGNYRVDANSESELETEIERSVEWVDSLSGEIERASTFAETKALQHRLDIAKSYTSGLMRAQHFVALAHQQLEAKTHEHRFNEAYGFCAGCGRDWRSIELTRPKDKFYTQAELEAKVAETQTNAVAWAVMVVDDLHFKGGSILGHDKLYKGIKNTLRDRYKAEVGIDPAPHYPVTAHLTFTTNKEKLV